MSGKSSDSAPAPARPKLLQQVHDAIRRRYYSRRTEEAYVHWIKRFIYFHGKRHPRDLKIWLLITLEAWLRGVLKPEPVPR